VGTPDPNELRRSRLRVGAVLAGMRIRKKLVFLHTCFSLVLAGILALALRPAVREVVGRAEVHEAQTIAQLLVARLPERPFENGFTYPEAVECRVGTPGEVGLTPDEERRVQAAAAGGGTPGVAGGNGVVTLEESTGRGPAPRVAAYDPTSGRFVVVSVKLESARSAVVRLYIAMTLALLAVYALVAAALEIFVLPEHVYQPIRRLLAADLAVQEGRRDEEIIPEGAIPRDELGEIMRSRNESITAMRRHERDLGTALGRLEEVATDLKRKNYLLEAARRNLADADRLASLGVMSAGLAHEMNTPLAVLKGMVEKLQRAGSAGVSPAEAQLMGRVVSRLEGLSESLLDFARVRPPRTRPVEVRAVVEEAWTLVSLDREAKSVAFENRVEPGTVVECDPDRIVQVLVNLLRNAVDAMAEAPGGRPGGGTARIDVDAHASVRDGREWVSLTISDNGPGIDPELLPRLFEPFASTRLDSRGTGLGLAVSEGIVSEHGGLLLARNRREASVAEPARLPAVRGEEARVGGGGAVFEIVLPCRRDDAAPALRVPNGAGGGSAGESRASGSGGV
jgi:signal transduction histidine kinase